MPGGVELTIDTEELRPENRIMISLHGEATVKHS